MKITLSPSGHSFDAQPGETVLQSALRHKVMLPYGCNTGSCGTCRARILSGEVDHGRSQPGVLSDTAREQGWALLCCAVPRSEVVVQAESLTGLSGQTVQRVPALVMAVDKPTAEVMLLQVKLPPRPSFAYRPGQYVAILLKNSQRRSFSIANTPGASDGEGVLEFHIRHIPGGSFTSRLFAEAKEKDVLRVEGPFGTFVLRESDKPAVWVVGGTGFAPAKAMIEEALASNTQRQMFLYWGAVEEEGFYLDRLPRQWAAQHRNFTYVPVLSGVGEGWKGRRGLVTEAVRQDFSSLADVEIYACGSPGMVEAARRDFLEGNLPPAAFYSDPFTFIPHSP